MTFNIRNEKTEDTCQILGEIWHGSCEGTYWKLEQNEKSLTRI